MSLWMINSSDAGDGILALGICGFGGYTMPDDALAPKGARASADMVLAV